MPRAVPSPCGAHPIPVYLTSRAPPPARNEAAAAGRANELSRAPVPADAAPSLRAGRCAARKLLLRLLENCAWDDRLVVIAQVYLLLLPPIDLFFVIQEIRRIRLFLQQVATVFFIPQQTQHHRGGPRLPFGAGRLDARLRQLPRDHKGSFPLVQKFAVYQPDHLRLVLLHRQPAVEQGKAVDIVAPEHHAVLHGAPLPPFDPLRGLAAFLLRHARHNRQAELAVVLTSIDPVIDEYHAHPVPPEPPRAGQRIHRVAGEAGHLLGQDQVDLPLLRGGQHLLKGRPVARGGAGQSLVRIHPRQLPVRLAADILREIAALVFQGVPLVVLRCRYAAVRGDPKLCAGHRSPARSLSSARSNCASLICPASRSFFSRPVLTALHRFSRSFSSIRIPFPSSLPAYAAVSPRYSCGSLYR